MTDHLNYKASFKSPKNKYLKFFCDTPASKWSLKNFRKHFKQGFSKDPAAVYKSTLQKVKMHSKGIPEPILLKIDAQLHKLKSPTSSPTPEPSPTTISIGNYYVHQGEGDLIVNNSSEEPHKKKQKVHHDEQEERGPDFYEKLATFLADEESDINFHKYSPEKNGVLKLTNKPKPRLPMSTSTPQLKSFIEALLYNASTELVDNIDNTRNLAEHKAECRFVKRIFLVMANVVNKSPSMTHSEATFNYKLLHPCLEATVNLLCHASHPGPYYAPGEEPLEAMIQQLVLIGSKIDRRKVYHADGIIRLRDFYDIEVLLLETAGHFQNKDTRKICFDNSKGMFALLAMFKSIADHFSRALPETFQKLKLYFVQASDEYIHLWSAQYANNGIYKFALEDKVEVTEDRQQLQQSSVSLLDFFFNVKTCLTKTFDVLQKLQREDEENNEVNSQEVLLSDIICPRIFRLTYNTHGKGFGTQS